MDPVEITAYLIAAVVWVIPAWRVCRRAGLAPAWSLALFVPYIGITVVLGVLAFAGWPAAAGAVAEGED